MKGTLVRSLRRASRRTVLRKASSWLALSLIASSHVAMLLPAPALAAPTDPGSGPLLATPEDEPAKRQYFPGFQFMEQMRTNSGLTEFHPTPGTFDEGSPSPETLKALFEKEGHEKRGWDRKVKVVKIFSSKKVDVGMYAVRYRTNQHFGVMRFAEYDEIVFVGLPGADSQPMEPVGTFFTIDPIWGTTMPPIDNTWKTAVGGIGAVAAAAAAMAAAAASGGAAAGAAGAAAGAASGGSDRDPNREIGFILQLSAKRVDVTRSRPALLEATVWRVRGSGAYEPAPDVEVLLAAPEGYTAEPASGMGSVRATVSQGPKAAGTGAIAVMANGPASGTTDYVEIVGEVPNRIVWRLEPAGQPLVPNGKHKLTLIADVQLSPGLQTQGASVLEAARQSMVFRGVGDWAEVSEPVTWTDGGRAVSVLAATPDPTRRVQPPETIEVHITAEVDGVQVSQTAKIPCGGLPELEIKPETLEFAQGCEKEFDLKARVLNSAGAKWTVTAEWKEHSPVLGDLSVVEPQQDAATVRLKESAPKNPDPNRPRTVGTLRIIASADDFEDVEREIQVASLREGLYPDTINQMPDGTFHVAADGSAKPTDIGFRVYVADPATGKITVDAAAAKGLDFEMNDDPGSPQDNLYQFARFGPVFSAMRDTGSGPTGVYRFAIEKKIPGKTPLTELACYVSVPGRDKEDFGYDLRLGLKTPATAPGSPQWNLEYERCSKIISEFCPPKYQAKLRETLETRGRQLGAEGLAEMRKRIWFISAELVLAEGAAGYEAEAAWADRIATALDWASYCGDICFGIVIGMYMGPYSAFAVTTLKPMLISALIAYREGQDPESWLKEQLYSIPAIFEGKAIDPDNFAKLTGGSKAKAWALYCSYFFFKEYFYNKKSFVEAIRSVATNVAEEVLIGWLGEKVRANGIPAGATKPGDNTVRPADSFKPVDTAKPVDGARPPKPADTARPADGAKPADAAKPAEGAPKPSDGDARTPHDATPEGPRKPKPGDPDWDPSADAADWVRGAENTSGRKPGETKPETRADRGERQRKGPPDPDRKTPEKPKRPELNDTTRTVMENTHTGPDGRKYADLDKTLEIMRDPTKVRDLKNAPPEVQAAFENTRRAIYESHDARVVDAARRAPGMYGKTIKVLEFRTPGQSGNSLNTDRDFRVCYESTDPVTGKKVWIEVDPKTWKTESDRAFTDLTGGPKPADPDHPTDSELKAMTDWAEKHQQLGTDKSHKEASADFTDQGFTRDPATGDLVKTQVTPNIELVKQGKSKLIDPDGLGRMFEVKVTEALHVNKSVPESYAQARKGVEQLDAVREGYGKAGYEVGQLNPKMQVAMDAVADAGKNSTDPAAVAHAEQVLREQGYSGLPDFMSKLSSQFASLKNVRQR